MADMKKVYDDLININLYQGHKVRHNKPRYLRSFIKVYAAVAFANTYFLCISLIFRVFGHLRKRLRTSNCQIFSLWTHPRWEICPQNQSETVRDKECQPGTSKADQTCILNRAFLHPHQVALVEFHSNLHSDIPCQNICRKVQLYLFIFNFVTAVIR